MALEQIGGREEREKEKEDGKNGVCRLEHAEWRRCEQIQTLGSDPRASKAGGRAKSWR